MSSFGGDFQLDSPDSGFKTPRAVRRNLEQFKGRNPIGSFVDDTPIHSVTATSGVDVKEPEVRVSHEDQVSCVRKKLSQHLLL